MIKNLISGLGIRGIYFGGENEVLKRAFMFRLDSSTVLYPPKFDKRVGLGFDWAGAAGPMSSSGYAGVARDGLGVCGKLMAAKIITLAEIYSAAPVSIPRGPQ